METPTIMRSRASATPSDTSLRSSSKSTSSRRKAGYSHPLYHAQIKAPELESDDIPDLVSRFSSCSTSPNSSSDSLNILQVPSPRHSEVSCKSINSVRSARSGSNQSTRSVISTCLRYADDHYPLISSVSNSHADLLIQMSHSYNTYIRALNSCYNHASDVTEEQVSDFLFFNQTLFNILSLHLKVEQQFILPLLQKPVADPRSNARKTVLINDNQTFLSAFSSWAKYIHAPASYKNFSGELVRSQLKTFAPLLVQHFHDEISELNILIGSGVLLQKHLAKIWSKVTDSLTSSLDIYTDIALLVGCQDKDFTINGFHAEQQYPQLSMTTTAMVKKLHSRKHSGAWKFCSSDFSGRRRLIHSQTTF